MALHLLFLLAMVLLSSSPLFARNLQEELAGNFINCQNVGAGVLDSKLLRTAPVGTVNVYGYFISKIAASPLDAKISVQVLRDLRSDIEQATSSMRVVTGQRRWWAMFPAVVWCNNRWHTITRLSDMGDMAGAWKMSTYLLTQSFDEKFEPASPPRIVGLPVFLNGVDFSGLEDPRVLVRNGHLLIQGNVHIPDAQTRHEHSRIGVFDGGTSTGVVLDVPGHELYGWEKSWTGFLKDGSLHYLYSLHPLVELQCNDDGNCEVVYHQELCPAPPCVGVSPRGQEPEAKFLRGGSSLIPWNGTESGYYVGFAHTNLQGPPWDEATKGLNVPPRPPGIGWHKAHLIVYNSREHRIIYVSSPIVLGEAAIQNIAPRYNGVVQDPTSLVLTPEGHIVMGINLDDSHPIIAVVDGLVPIIEQVIRMDQSPDAAAAGASGAADDRDPDLLKCAMHVVRKHFRDLGY